VGTWKNEDEIKAELRSLTQELRQLREELRELITPPKPGPARALLQRQTWPAPAAHEPVEKAADSSEKQPRKRQKK
jgi:hypothetical protein